MTLLSCSIYGTSLRTDEVNVNTTTTTTTTTTHFGMEYQPVIQEN